MNRELRILFEDDDILVVDKPSGMAVHASPGYEEHSLADTLAKTRPQMLTAGSRERPGVVHRLDVDTSGVMVLAKSVRAYKALRENFEHHCGVVKTYLAVLHGAPRPRQGVIDKSLARRADKVRMKVVEPDFQGAEYALTHYETLGVRGPVALVKFVIETGRTHQIRVHAAFLGHPVVGDRLYGDSAKDARLMHRPTRLLLHAVELEFDHPVSNERLRFAAEVPRELIYV